MPFQDRLESGLVLADDEPLEELRLAQRRDGPRTEEALQRVDDRPEMLARHGSGLIALCHFPHECTGRDERSIFFFDSVSTN